MERVSGCLFMLPDRIAGEENRRSDRHAIILVTRFVGAIIHRDYLRDGIGANNNSAGNDTTG